MAAGGGQLSSTMERQTALRKWYEETALRLLDLPAGGEMMADLLDEWPSLYPPWTKRLDEYDRDTFGPLLAVSDEGSAAPAIARAAYGSAKARALARADAMSLGMVIDGERMTSAGEAPIGPEEYEALMSSAFGRTLCSTNVGVRVNTRLYRLLPEFALVSEGEIESAWIAEVMAAFNPFINTPDKRPRPLTVRIRVAAGTTPERLKDLFGKLEAGRAQFGLASSVIHRFGLLLSFDHEIRSQADKDEIVRLMDGAAGAGFFELAVDGEPLVAARQRLMLPSLLNIIEQTSVKSLLDAARQRRVELRYRYQTDAESAARTIWTGLQAARSFGFTAGKYGMVPLMLEEQQIVVERVSRWMKGWTAIPAFYADMVLVTQDDIYEESRCVEAAFLWMDKVAAAGAKMILIDCPDRVSPRHLVRDPQAKDSKGVLTLEQIIEIDRRAVELGLKALWSGGLTARQAFSLAAKKVFGLFSTSATASKIAVQGGLVQDPQLAVEGEPTEDGVRRVHAAIGCGFLSAALKGELAHEIEDCGLKLLDAIDAGKGLAEALAASDDALGRGWKAHWEARGAAVGRRTSGFAAPPDAVRVWRGRRKKDLDQKSFFEKLGSIFIPFTVEMQRLYGLTAYLPAVLPGTKPESTPDEIALVFYKTQQSYTDAKKCPGGRAYSDLHGLVFDLSASASGFPKLLTGNFELNQPWHLFSNAVDWQKGSAQVYCGVRKQSLSLDDFRSGAGAVAKSVQAAGGLVDGAILLATEDYLIYWQHVPDGAAPMPSFSGMTDIVYTQTAQPTKLEPELTVPWDGVAVRGGEFFNMQFPVL
jgi:hypothetical protein